MQFVILRWECMEIYVYLDEYVWFITISQSQSNNKQQRLVIFICLVIYAICDFQQRLVLKYMFYLLSFSYWYMFIPFFICNNSFFLNFFFFIGDSKQASYKIVKNS